MFPAIPDFSMSVTDMVAYGDKAAVRWTATGTFNGPGRFQGVAPDRALGRLAGLDLLTIRDGLIQENFAYTNGMEMARQMGRCRPRLARRAGDAGRDEPRRPRRLDRRPRQRLRKLAER